MKIKSVNLETVIGPTTKHLPANTLPEVAYAGNSNVGKSSLINVLMNRKHLAHTSQKPGKTQTINFYNINRELYLVDLPGYGYTNAPESEKKKWGKMVERYLYESEQLACVFLLVDIRHEPSANDKQMYEWIDYMGYQTIVIATKADKLKPSQIDSHLSVIEDVLSMEEDGILIPFSSKTKEGLDDIYDLMDQVIENAQESDDSSENLPESDDQAENSGVER
ncbi:MAG: YihA family ribosome biogenesis GTP-binding protein [Lachnospiraceae bacterium]|nr:YihA family ribosome biogenesis GTP-binding protein [Lachnospiraceae bacterium]